MIGARLASDLCRFVLQAGRDLPLVVRGRGLPLRLERSKDSPPGRDTREQVPSCLDQVAVIAQ